MEKDDDWLKQVAWSDSEQEADSYGRIENSWQRGAAGAESGCREKCREKETESSLVTSLQKAATCDTNNFLLAGGECVYYLNGCCGKEVRSYARLAWEGLRTEIHPMKLGGVTTHVSE